MIDVQCELFHHLLPGLLGILGLGSVCLLRLLGEVHAPELLELAHPVHCEQQADDGHENKANDAATIEKWHVARIPECAHDLVDDIPVNDHAGADHYHDIDQGDPKHLCQFEALPGIQGVAVLLGHHCN